MNNLSMIATVFDGKLEYLLIHHFLANTPNHEIQSMFKGSLLYNYDDFLEYIEHRLLDMRRQKHNVSTRFNSRKIKLINDIILYYKFMINNNNEVMAEYPNQWVKEDFRDWINWTAGGKTTTTTAYFLWNTNNRNEENSISNEAQHADSHSDELVMANTEVVVSNENCSNLTAADATADDDIDNAKSPTGCENSIGDLDGIRDEYYQEKGTAPETISAIHEEDISNTPTEPTIVSTEEVISGNSAEKGTNGVADDDDTAATTTTTTMPKSDLKEEEFAPEIDASVVSSEDDSSSADNVATAVMKEDEDDVSATTTAAANDKIDNAKFQSSKVSVSVPVPVLITISPTTTTALVSNEEIIPNLHTAAADAEEDVDNAKFLFECENSIGSLDGIKGEYYQVKESNKDDDADVRYDGVPVDNYNYGVIYDRSDTVNPPPLPPESPAYAIHIPCIHSNIPNDGEMIPLPLFSSVYRVKQSDQMENNGLHDSPKAVTDFPTYEINSNPGFWDDADDDDDEIDNSIFYSSMETPTAAPESVSNEEVISNLSVTVADDDDDDIVLEIVKPYQYRRLNTWIEEVNEEYPFWRPNSDEEYLTAATPDDDDGIHSRDEEYLATAATDDEDVFRSRDEEYPDEEEHHEDLNVGVLDGTRRDILYVESNMVADAEDDVDNAKSQFKCENSIGSLDGIRYKYYLHNNHGSVDNGAYVGSNVVPNPIYGAICDRSNAENPPPLPPESLDDDVWNLERDQSHDDNNSFNYVDIEKEILQSKHEDLTGDYETIVFSDGDDILNVKLQVEYENSTSDLNGIQRDYPMVNKVSDDANSPPPPQEHPPRPSIMLHDDNNEADVGNNGVPDDNDNYGVTHDRTDDTNPPSLPPESNIPCIHSIIGKVNEEFQFWNDTSNEEGYGNNDYTCNDTVTNQAESNRPTNGESKIGMLRSSNHLDHSQIKVSIRETNILNTLICEINEEYSLCRTHRNKEYPFDSIPASTKSKASQEIGRYDQEEYHDDSIGVVDSIRQEEESGTNVARDYGDDDDIKYISTCYRSNDDNPPPLPPESLDDDVRKLERYHVENDNTAYTKLEWTFKKYHIINTMYKDLNNNTRDSFYLYGNRPDNVDTCWYYFDCSNNGEIPEDELNYQTSGIYSIETPSTMKWMILVRRLGSDRNDEYHEETIDVCKTKTNVVVQVIMPNDRFGTDIDVFIDYVVSDSSTIKERSDNYEDGYVDITFANEVECLEWYMQKYQVDNDTKLDWILKWYRIDNTKLEWSFKKCRVDNIKFDQKKELKRCDHTDATKEDQGYSMPDLLDHLDSISSKQDPYSNFKEEMKSNRCDHDILCSNQEPLKRAHSLQRMLSSPMERKDGECPDPEVKLYYRGAHRQRYLGKPLGEMDYVWGDNESMSNSPTVPEAKLHKRHSILSFHYVISMISRGFINLQHLASESNFADMLTKNGSYQSSYYKLIQPLFHHSGNTAALFLDDILEVDVSIAEGSIFGILGSEKLSNYCYVLAVKQSEKPMNGMHVCGQDIVETSIYYSKKTTTGTIRIVRYSKRYVYYGKKTTTGTVGIVP